MINSKLKLYLRYWSKDNSTYAFESSSFLIKENEEAPNFQCGTEGKMNIHYKVDILSIHAIVSEFIQVISEKITPNNAVKTLTWMGYSILTKSNGVPLITNTLAIKFEKEEMSEEFKNKVGEILNLSSYLFSGWVNLEIENIILRNINSAGESIWNAERVVYLNENNEVHFFENVNMKFNDKTDPLGLNGILSKIKAFDALRLDNITEMDITNSEVTVLTKSKDIFIKEVTSEESSIKVIRPFI